jgi:hypothetical protein
MRLYVLLGLLCLVSIVFASGGYDIPPTATGDFKADGSVPMLGNLNIGTNDITEVVKIKSDNNSLDAIDVSERRLHDTTGSLKLDWNLGYWFGDFNFTSNVVGGVADPVGDYDAVNKRTLASYVPTTRTVTVNGVEGVLSSNISFTVAEGISASTASNIAQDAYSPAYVLAPASGTATVTRTVSGTYYREFTTILASQTVLHIDTSTFPTNGGSIFAWSVNPNGQVISVNPASIDTNSWNALTLTTNAYNDLIFRKAPYATVFKVQGE